MKRDFPIYEPPDKFAVQSSPRRVSLSLSFPLRKNLQDQTNNSYRISSFSLFLNVFNYVYVRVRQTYFTAHSHINGPHSHKLSSMFSFNPFNLSYFYSNDRLMIYLRTVFLDLICWLFIYIRCYRISTGMACVFIYELLVRRIDSR